MSATSAAATNPRTSSSALGVLWIVYALLRIAAVILLVLYSGTATVMFGALLSRVADPYTLMAAFHIFYICAVIVPALSGLVGLFAGLALLAGKSSVRSLAIIASILSLCDLPLGTTLGIYTLVVFLP
ncbi:MAG: hypothetical protein WBE73_16300 [Candidatus Acidiferrum sp.]